MLVIPNNLSQFMLMMMVIANPLTCQGTGFCGFNTGFSAFGCCAGTAGASLVGCNIVTKCYDSSKFSECGQACQSNTMNAWW